MELPHPVTCVRNCTSSSAKTLRLKHPQLPDLDASGGPSDDTSVFHHWTYDLVTAEHRSWWTEYSSCKDPTLPVSGKLFSKAGSCGAISSAVFLGVYKDNLISPLCIRVLYLLAAKTNSVSVPCTSIPAE